MMWMVEVLNKQFQLSRLATKQAFKNFLLNKTEQNLNIYKIAKLKRDGRNYTKEQFLRLFQIVSRNNVIKISHL